MSQVQPTATVKTIAQTLTVASPRGVETSLGRVSVRRFGLPRYRTCIKPSSPENLQVIAERLKGFNGWSAPENRTPYFTKYFSVEADKEAIAAIREE